MRKFISILLAAIMLFSVCVIPGNAQSSEKNGSGSNPASDARNGVVRILAAKLGQDENGNSYISFSTGTGFAVGTAGEPSAMFVTNQHVIEDAIAVYLLLDDEWYDEWIQDFSASNMDVAMEHAVKCEVIYTPTAYPDYAILRAERVVTERVALPLMSPNLVDPGDTVYTLGYPASSDVASSATGSEAYLDEIPASIDSMTVSKGTISRFTQMASKGNCDVIQIDATIHQGNSGGPLITEDGIVIGINTWNAAPDGLMVYFSLSIDYTIERLENLRETGVLSGFEFTVITDLEAYRAEQEQQTVVEDDKQDLTLLWIILGSVLGVAAIVILIIVLVKKNSGNKVVKSFSAPQPVSTQPTTPKADKDDFPKTVPITDVIPKTMPVYGANSYRLVGETGFFSGRRFAVDRPLNIGRDPQKNDLVYAPDVAGVSGVHCIVTPVADGVSLTDAGSSYGTILGDGTKLTPKETVILKEGDSFYLGSQKQMFKIEKKEV